MSATRPFARYTGSGTPSGTERYGDLLVGVDSTLPYNSNYSGVKWWSGADEDLGYIIATTVATEDQPTQNDGNVGSVGFFSTFNFNNSDFSNLVKVVTGYTPSSALDAKNYLLSNGYWTSWSDTSDLVMNLDASDVDSYPGTGTTWFDISYNGNDGVITNATYTTISGIDTFSFDGNGDFVSIGQPIPTGSSYSISAWVYANNTTLSHNIVSSESSPFWVASGTLYAGVGNSYFEVSSALPLNTWKHVAMTFNTTSNTMTLYINGVQVSQNTNVTSDYTAQNTFIGSHFSGGNNVSFWSGYIAQVKIYTSEQTSSQILNHFNLTKSKYGL